MKEPIIQFDILALVVIMILAVLALVSFGLRMIKPNAAQSRLKAVLKEREELSAQQKEQMEQARRQQRTDRQVGVMRNVVNALRLQGDTTSRKLRLKLGRAGWRGQGPVITYVFMRLSLPLLFGLFAALVAFGGRGGEDWSFNSKLLICVIAGAAGYVLPAIIVINAIQRRKHELRRGYPDALDLLVICVEAGLSLDAAFTRVTEEMEETLPIIAEEFGLTSAELAFLGDRRQALVNLAERTDLDDFRSLTTALVQAERYGTSVGLTLRVLAKENRDQRVARALEKAGRLPATLTVPMITLILPVLFIVLIGPAAIQAFRTLSH